MNIKQFEDKNLAHYSYVVISNGEAAVIDPSRNPQPYYDYAKTQNATIKAVVETHPHADFVSSHLEIGKTTGASIYASKLTVAEYPHKAFDSGDKLTLGDVSLYATNTPGHSPDSISVVVINDEGEKEAVFTGDTLFIGDCGRPDLREQNEDLNTQRLVLARQMYHSLRGQLLTLPDETIVYPAHGAGTLCGKSLSNANSSTIGNERRTNWSLQSMSEEEFIKQLLADQPFIPKYFPFDVALNKKGADDFAISVATVAKRGVLNSSDKAKELANDVLIIDSRPQARFKKSHLENAINLMSDTKFETWLGSIVNPRERFYLIAENQTVLESLVERIAKIGYEKQIEAAYTGDYGDTSTDVFESDALKNHPGEYTIVDVRNDSEVKAKPIFPNAVHIPIDKLRERIKEIPIDKPIVVHCAGGYRSAAASSIVQSKITNTNVYDLGEAIKSFIP